MKTYRFEAIYKCFDETTKKLMVNIPLDVLSNCTESFTQTARDWLKQEKGLDCIFARYRGFSYTQEDLITAKKIGQGKIKL